jgi:hypothetical protein
VPPPVEAPPTLVARKGDQGSRGKGNPNAHQGTKQGRGRRAGEMEGCSYECGFDDASPLAACPVRIPRLLIWPLLRRACSRCYPCVTIRADAMLVLGHEHHGEGAVTVPVGNAFLACPFVTGASSESPRSIDLYSVTSESESLELPAKRLFGGDFSLVEPPRPLHFRVGLSVPTVARRSLSKPPPELSNRSHNIHAKSLANASPIRMSSSNT